jgi:4-cresol dehydrogenase (hydroxylating)
MTKAHAAFRDKVSDLVCEEARTLSDLSGHSRRIAGRLSARTTLDVVRIVRAAGLHGIKLHPVSCGKNWGFGSALPSINGAWIVDLGNMTNIRAYSPECGSICIEPGVTQLMLHQALEKEGREWLFNVTGAGESTSVLGNALERGIGYHGHRHLDLVELEVVTGTGEAFWTRLGNGHLSECGAPLGPDITQLFPQAGFGIVTSARLRLIKRTNGSGVIIARLRDETRAEEFFQKILMLKRDGCITGVPHIANRQRIVTTMLPWLAPEQQRSFMDKASSAWTAALPMQGCREITMAAAGVIEASLSKLGDLEVILGEDNLPAPSTSSSPMDQLKQLASGFPSNLALPSVQWSALGKADVTVLDPEKTNAGLIHVTPAVPSSATEIGNALRLIESTARELGLQPLALTVNVVDSLTTVIVISVPFIKTEAAPAHIKAQKLWRALSGAGIHPYRLGLGNEQEMGSASRNSADIFNRIRSALDTNGVFAPSKYDSLFVKPPKVVSAKRSRQASVISNLRKAA